MKIKVIIYKETAKAYEVSLAQLFRGEIVFGRSWVARSITKIIAEETKQVKGNDLRIAYIDVPAWWCKKIEGGYLSKIQVYWTEEDHIGAYEFK
jgi:hypothetical protein